MRRLLLALLLSCACGLTPKPSPAEPTDVVAAGTVAGPMLYAGERFEVHAATSGVTLASLSLEVAPPCRFKGEEMLPVIAHAERKGIASAFASGHIDSTSFLEVQERMPRFQYTHVERTKRSYDLATEWLVDGYRHRHQIVGRKVRDKTVSLPPDMLVYEPLSAVGAMRTWSGQLGAQDAVHVLMGRRLWRLDLHVAEHDSVWIGDESRQAVRIDGIARRVMTRQLKTGRAVRKWSLWVSDDAQRLPLRATIETRKQRVIELSLVDYAFEDVDQSGTAPCQGAARLSRVPPD
jgi:hypothetical protein